MAKIYSTISTKGGIGKTTVAANLAALLADMGQRVLLVDTDFAQNLSKYFSIPEPAEGGLTQLITRADPTDCISHTGYDGLDIVQNDDALGDKGGAILPFLRQSSTHILYLNHALQKVDQDYDYILIDTQGASGLVQEAVILASDELISPVKPNYLDSTEFVTGTVAMLRMLLPMPGSNTTIAGKPMPVCSAVINQVDRTTDSRDVSRWLRQQFDTEGDGLVRVLNTMIPDLAAYNKAAGASLPAHRYPHRSRGRAPSPRETMLELAYELQPKLIGIEPKGETA